MDIITIGIIVIATFIILIILTYKSRKLDSREALLNSIKLDIKNKFERIEEREKKLIDYEARIIDNEKRIKILEENLKLDYENKVEEFKKAEEEKTKKAVEFLRKQFEIDDTKFKSSLEKKLKAEFEEKEIELKKKYESDIKEAEDRVRKECEEEINSIYNEININTSNNKNNIEVEKSKEETVEQNEKEPIEEETVEQNEKELIEEENTKFQYIYNDDLFGRTLYEKNSMNIHDAYIGLFKNIKWTSFALCSSYIEYPNEMKQEINDAVSLKRDGWLISSLYNYKRILDKYKLITYDFIKCIWKVLISSGNIYDTLDFIFDVNRQFIEDDSKIFDTEALAADYIEITNYYTFNRPGLIQRIKEWRGSNNKDIVILHDVNMTNNEPIQELFNRVYNWSLICKKEEEKYYEEDS